MSQGLTFAAGVCGSQLTWVRLGWPLRRQQSQVSGCQTVHAATRHTDFCAVSGLCAPPGLLQLEHDETHSSRSMHMHKQLLLPVSSAHWGSSKGGEWQQGIQATHVCCLEGMCSTHRQQRAGAKVCAHWGSSKGGGWQEHIQVQATCVRCPERVQRRGSVIRQLACRVELRCTCSTAC